MALNLSAVPPSVLERLLSLTKSLTSRRDLDSVLHELLQASINLIPGADFACVFLYRPEDNALHPVGGVGFDMDVLRDVWLRPGESMTGQAFVKREALLFPNPAAIKRAQANLSPVHDQAVRRAVGRPENPVRSSLAVPLIAEPRMVGVLVIDNYDTDRDFGEVDLAVTVSLAEHAAVAVLNAEDYERVHKLSAELGKTLAVQQRLLASMMSPQESLPELLRTLWTIVHKPLAIYGPGQKLEAFYGGAVREPVNFAVRVGGRELGRLAVGQGPLAGIDRTAVEQALPLIALEFLKQQALEQERVHAHADAFIRIWDGDQGAVEGIVRKFAGGNGRWRFVIAQGFSPETSEALTAWSHAHSTLAMSFESARLMLLPEELFETFQSWAGDHSVWLFCGEVGDDPQEMTPELRSTVFLWRDYYANTADPGAKTCEPRTLWLADYPEIKALQNVPEAARAAYVAKMLSALAADALLLDTLKTWVHSGRSYERAAQRMHTHPNTIRYRIEKASQLLGRPVTDDQTVVQLRLAFLWTVESRL